MDIKVDRVNTPEGNLVFTITVSNPHHSCFGENEKNIMNYLDTCKENVSKSTSVENKLAQDVIGLIHASKEKTFTRVLSNLKFAIENEFRPKFQPICQEIYNWIYDHQTVMLKSWMSEFDPQRTKYYFDNDKKNLPSHDPHYISDDKIDDEDDED
jgi:hypothetical protein